MKKIPLIAGNWKMHPATMAEVTALAKGVAKQVKGCTRVEAAIFPTALHLTTAKKALGKSNIALGAQNMSAGKLGSETGEISALMLRDIMATHVIIGHSERRASGEGDETVNQKLHTALAHKLIPIVCVGERERDKNGQYLTVIRHQVRAAFAGLSQAKAKSVIIAYEPIWAIGTGDTATPADAEEMKLYIQKILTDLYDRSTAAKIMILYGGSVKASNADLLFKEGNVDGFLVGGASLEAVEFGSIIKTVNDLV